MRVIVVANQKGGIGKTTTATAIASILDSEGYRTLLIDSDQQGNSTDTYRAEIEGVATLYDVLLGEHISLEQAIQKTENGDIVASDPLLREGDSKLSADPEGEYRMLNAIENLNGYDYVIIDTAPAMNLILRNCLIAANSIVIPITADRYGLQGLAQLSDTITAIKKRQNKDLTIKGLLLIKYNGRTNLGKEVKDSLENIALSMGTKLFKSTIRESTKAKEAQALRTTLIKYAPTSTTAEDYKNFVKELIGDEKNGIK